MRSATILSLLVLLQVVASGATTPRQDERPPIQRPRAQHAELSEPAGVALRDDGLLFVSELNTGRVVRVPMVGDSSVFAEGLRGPRDLELDGEQLWVVESRGPAVVALGLDGARVVELGARVLLRPYGLALTKEHVYVTDVASHRVEVFDHEGEYVFGFGGHGFATGQFIEPRDVAIGADGRIYVADFGNSRVQIFDDKGAHLGGWGDWGPFPGLFMGPSGIEVRAGEVYVIDERNHRVQRFDLEGKALGQFGLHAIRPREGGGKLHYPRALALSPDAELAAVVEPLVDRAQIFSRTGGEEEDALRKQVTSLARPSAHFGTGLTISGPYLAIPEPESHTVLLYENTWDEPRRITRVSGLGVKTGLLSAVAGIDLARADRSLLVCDPAMRRLSMFRLHGSEEDEVGFEPLMSYFVKSYDFAAGFGTVELHAHEGIPEPLAVDRAPDGRIYVLDRRNRGVIVMTRDFAPLLEQRTSFVFSEPADLAVDREGKRYAVTDPGGRAVYLFDADGPPDEGRAVGAQLGLVEPHGVVFDEEGRLYVTDAGRDEVLVFDREGQFLRRWGSRGLGRVEFLEPRGIAIDARGRVVVSDHANHRAQVFSPEGEYLGIFGSRLYTKPARYPDSTTPGDEE